MLNKKKRVLPAFFYSVSAKAGSVRILFISASAGFARLFFISASAGFARILFISASAGFARFLFISASVGSARFIYPFHHVSLVRQRACATQFMVLQKGTLTASSFLRYWYCHGATISILPVAQYSMRSADGW